MSDTLAAEAAAVPEGGVVDHVAPPRRVAEQQVVLAAEKDVFRRLDAVQVPHPGEVVPDALERNERIGELAVLEIRQRYRDIVESPLLEGGRPG